MLTKYEISNVLTSWFANDQRISGIGIGTDVYVYIIGISESFEISRKLDELFPDQENRKQIKIQITGKIKPL